MKRSSFASHRVRRALSAFALAPFLASAEPAPPAAPAAPAAPVNSQLSAYQSSVAEEGVRKDTDKVQAEIAELLGELKLNGLSQADGILLANAATNLKSLSQEDMQKVISTLQSASMASQEADRQSSLVTAFKDQGTVTLKLKALAAQLAAQESQKELPAKLQNLIARQSANIRQTSKLPDVVVAKLSGGQVAVQGVVSGEQTAIEGEIDLLYQGLSDATQSTPTDGSDPALNKALFEAMNSHPLRDAAGAATQLTAKGPFPDAVGDQKTVRDYLTVLLRVAMSKMDSVAQLQEAKSQLSQISSDQKDLADVAKQSKLDGATLAERQAKLNDRAAATQALLKAISPPAAAQLAQAQQAMQQSSDALEKAKDTATTAPQQQQVAQDLDKTAAALDQQIADAQKQEDASPADKLAQMQKLQDELAAAQKNPNLNSADLQQIQQEAASLSTPAANKIADAQDTLSQNTPDPTQPVDPQQPQNSDPAAPQNQQSQQNQTAQQSPQKQPDQNSQSPSDQNQQSPQNQSSQTAQNQQNQSGQPPQSQQNQSGQSPQSQPNQPGQQQQGLTAQQSQQNEANEQAADQQLAQASDDLKAQADAMKASAAAYQALSQQSQQLSQAQQDANSANQAMSGSKPDLSDAAHDMAQAQAAVDQMKGDPSSSNLPAGTKDALQAASDALKSGSMDAVQAQAASAEDAGKKASDALAQAQAGLHQAMEQVRQSTEDEGQRQRDEIAQMENGEIENGPMEHMGNGRLQPFDSSGAHYHSLIPGWGPKAGAGSAQVIGALKPKDRAAIAQFQDEKSPPEYAAQVQQYLKNLADASESH